MIFAVCGKGGVGKTTFTAVAARELRGRREVKALVVDADPAAGLSLALGLEPRKTLNDVRKELIEEVRAGRRDQRDLAVSIDYLLAGALVEVDNLAFLSIGRPEDEGCYCRVNVILKDAIESLSSLFDVTVIDAEAGIEQVNRKVMGSVDRVMLVSDTGAKGIRVAETIGSVAEKMVAGEVAGLVINRVPQGVSGSRAYPASRLKVIGEVPEDSTVRWYDEKGASFFQLPDCPASRAIAESLKASGFPL